MYILLDIHSLYKFYIWKKIYYNKAGISISTALKNMVT